MKKRPPLSLKTRAMIVAAIVAAIFVAHVFMWLSDMPTGEKVMWTAFNTLSWVIILAPIFLVDRWLKAIEQRNRDGRESARAGLSPDE